MATIICDSREQRWEHVRVALEGLGFKTLRSKLPCGDYGLLSDLSHVIDRKAGLGEVASNLCQQHARFRRECELARGNGIRLTILVESENVRSLEDVASRTNPRRKPKQAAKPPVSGTVLAKVMQTMSKRYAVEWRFCRHEDAGAEIVRLLLP